MTLGDIKPCGRGPAYGLALAPFLAQPGSQPDELGIVEAVLDGKIAERCLGPIEHGG
jgi:hypothetical protein